MRRLMIAGATGMTGSEMCDRAPRFDWLVSPFSRKQLDITDGAAVESAIRSCGPDMIVNCAAYTAVDRAESEPVAAAAVNSKGARSLARAAEREGVPVIHISTDYVFRGDGQRPYKPEEDTDPLGVYGKTKLAGETAVREETPRHIIVRTSWVFSHRGNNFVKTILRLAAERDELRVVSDQIGRPTSAADLAEALLVAADALAKDRDCAGTYHFANAGETSWFEFARAVVDELRARGENRLPTLVPIETSEYPTAAKRPAYSVLDTTSFTARFGVIPRAWPEALRDAIDLSFSQAPAAHA